MVTFLSAIFFVCRFYLRAFCINISVYLYCAFIYLFIVLALVGIAQEARESPRYLRGRQQQAQASEQEQSQPHQVT